MCAEFDIPKNNYLNRNVFGYYHQFYTGYQKPGNPDFINTLKNTFNDTDIQTLVQARDRVVVILNNDLPQIMINQNISDCLLVGVPRAKALASYTRNQLLLKEALKISANNTNGIIDGTNCIRRIIDTKTTHIHKTISISNDGDEPYPGITAATCQIDKHSIWNKNVILVDDIYTKNINVDEDCIQALYDNGAARVIFYAIGFTRRD